MAISRPRRRRACSSSRSTMLRDPTKISPVTLACCRSCRPRIASAVALSCPNRTPRRCPACGPARPRTKPRRPREPRRPRCESARSARSPVGTATPAPRQTRPPSSRETPHPDRRWRKHRTPAAELDPQSIGGVTNLRGCRRCPSIPSGSRALSARACGSMIVFGVPVVPTLIISSAGGRAAPPESPVRPSAAPRTRPLRRRPAARRRSR